MTDTVRTLANGFEKADRAAWRAAAEAALGAADSGSDAFERRLVRRTLDGVARGPLATRADAPPSTNAWPGEAPFSRGAYPTTDPRAFHWDIGEIIDDPDPARANAAARTALAGGAGSLELRIDPVGAEGVIVRGLDDLETVLSDVGADARVSVSAGVWGAHASALLAALSRTPRGALNLDPIGQLAVGADAPATLDPALSDAAAWARWADKSGRARSVFRADARIVHEAGGSEAWEIAYASACALAYLEAMAKHGAPVERGARLIDVAVAVDADVQLNIAKLRALRRVWGRIAAASGASADAVRPRVHAFSSDRMLARLEPWTNLVRLTAAGFAAACASVQSITLAAFSSPLGPPDAQARRLSRNMLLLLREECGIGRVADPAGGAYGPEALSDSLARKAWAHFQDVQRAGGIARFILEGRLHAEVERTRAARQSALERRDEVIVGVTEYAAPPLRDVEVDAIDRAAAVAAADARSRARPAPSAPAKRLTPETLIPLAAAGVDVRDMAETLRADRQRAPHPPLQPIRLSAPFEDASAPGDGS